MLVIAVKVLLTAFLLAFLGGLIYTFHARILPIEKIIPPKYVTFRLWEDIDPVMRKYGEEIRANPKEYRRWVGHSLYGIVMGLVPLYYVIWCTW